MLTAYFMLAGVGLFVLCHWWNVLPRVYACRRFLYPDRVIPYETAPSCRNLLSWLFDSFPVSDK